MSGTGIANYVTKWSGTSTVDTTGLFWGNGSRLGIGTTAPGASVQINGAGITSGTSSLLINNSTPSELFRVANNGLISIGKNVSVSTQSSSQIVATSGDANTNFVITPKGNGAFIIGPAPDGTSAGGLSRGAFSIDLGRGRSYPGYEATGSYSVILGGHSNLASGSYSTVLAGLNNTSSGDYSLTGGSGNTASGERSLAFGSNALSNLWASQAFASGQFSTQGDAQTLSWRYRRAITGTAQNDLTLNGADPSTTGRATLPANRAWNVRISVTAICSTAGGTVALGDSYIAEYIVGIKRIVNTTTLIGTVQNVITAQSDASMSSSVVTITADDTNECLRVQFTPPTTAGAGTVIRVVATATATVAGY
jgi:hypothetical protein